MKLPTLVLAALLLISCTPADDSEASLQTVIDTVSGVEHIRNAGVAPAWTLKAVARIGTVDSGPAAFGRVRSVVADAEGRIYVADNIANEVRVFAEDGSYVQSIGRSGAGPGEFGNISGLAWLGDDLVAMDPANGRIGRFTREGTWIDGIRYFALSGPATHIRLHTAGGGGFYAPVIAPGRRLPLVRFTADGTADTIAMPTAPPDARTYGIVCNRPDRAIEFISVPEAPTSLYSFPPPGGEIAVAWSETYRVARISSTGDTIAVIHREHGPVPYSDSLWQVALEPYETMLERFPGSSCEPSALVRPESRAVMREQVFDDTGQMWVEVASETGFAWEIFAADGALIGRADAPERAHGIPVYVRGNTLYQVETDENGVQYVAVYRLERN